MTYESKGKLERTLQFSLLHHLEKTPKSILLLGPRQTGKSTLLRSLKPQLEINLSQESTYRSYLSDTTLLESQVQTCPPHSVILIDEIQRLPSLLNTVQALIDSPRHYRFLLTGSSARKLKRDGINLLPGRIFRYDLFPLTYWELKDHGWDLQRALTRGTLPEIYLSGLGTEANDYGTELLGHYVELYLRHEILSEALARNVQGFARFLDLAAQSSGQILNYSQLASDSEIPKETIRRYVEILEDTLLIHRIPGFTETQGSRKPIQKEKLLFFDLGVRNAILRQQKNVFGAPELGALFEQFIVNQVLALISYRSLPWKVFFYRDDLKREVDLIIDLGKSAKKNQPPLVAVEIKYSRKFESSHLRGLKAFCSVAKRPVQTFIVYRGEIAQKREDTLVLPETQFLDLLASWA